MLDDFVEMMHADLPRWLPPTREVDHAIELVVGAKLLTIAPYRMDSTKHRETRRQLDDMLEVRPSKVPYGVLVLFPLKNLSGCVVLNKVTIQNKYPLPLLADQLGGIHLFSKLDLHSCYWQVMIVKEDKSKTTCVICYGAQCHSN